MNRKQRLVRTFPITLFATGMFFWFVGIPFFRNHPFAYNYAIGGPVVVICMTIGCLATHTPIALALGRWLPVERVRPMIWICMLGGLVSWALVSLLHHLTGWPLDTLFGSDLVFRWLSIVVVGMEVGLMMGLVYSLVILALRFKLPPRKKPHSRRRLRG